MIEGRPKLTVIVASFNTGRFLRSTLDSILSQTYENFECIVIDGGSTDETTAILKEYQGIEWISEKDSGYLEAFRKGLGRARGEYVTQCAVSDGYLEKDWLARCASVLDEDHNISLVWGLPRYISEDGRLLAVSYPQFHRRQPPQRDAFFYYWLRTQFWLPEGNFVVRKNVMEECFPPFTANAAREVEPWLEFNYAFNAHGYLPYYLPVVANYGRIHGNQLGEREIISGVAQAKFERYLRKCRVYRKEILFSGRHHVYRDGSGNVLPISFSRATFFWREILFPRSLVQNIISILKRAVKRCVLFLLGIGIGRVVLLKGIEKRRQRMLEFKKK
jgi:glycosyltransferase involved in cell wall biosynthesis